MCFFNIFCNGANKAEGLLFYLFFIIIVIIWGQLGWATFFYHKSLIFLTPCGQLGVRPSEVQKQLKVWECVRARKCAAFSQHESYIQEFLIALYEMKRSRETLASQWHTKLVAVKRCLAIFETQQSAIYTHTERTLSLIHIQMCIRDRC